MRDTAGVVAEAADEHLARAIGSDRLRLGVGPGNVLEIVHRGPPADAARVAAHEPQVIAWQVTRCSEAGDEQVSEGVGGEAVCDASAV